MNSMKQAASLEGHPRGPPEFIQFSSSEDCYHNCNQLGRKWMDHRASRAPGLGVSIVGDGFAVGVSNEAIDHLG